MAYLRYTLSKAVWRFAAATGEGWSLHYDLESEGLRGSLKMPNGDDLLKMSGALHLRSGAVEKREDGAFGAVHHLPAHPGSSDGVIKPSPDGFSIECTLPPDEIRALVGCEEVGHSATRIIVTVGDGIGYGHAPDGSDKIWLTEKSWVAVTALTFGFERPDTVGDLMHCKAEIEPPPINARLMQGLSTIEKMLGYIVAVLAGILVTVALR